MRERRKRPVALSDLVMKTAGRFKFKDELKARRLFSQWESAMGPIASHARPIRIKKGELLIRVDHPTWMHELSMLKPKLLDKISELIPDAFLKSIRLELGELPPDTSARGGRKTAAKKRALTEREQKCVEDAAGLIKDDELRKIARQTIERSFERETRK